MEVKKFLAGLIFNSQERFVWYKSQLQEVHKNANLYEDWYRELLRELKNTEIAWLKSLQEESQWINLK